MNGQPLMRKGETPLVTRLKRRTANGICFSHRIELHPGLNKAFRLGKRRVLRFEAVLCWTPRPGGKL